MFNGNLNQPWAFGDTLTIPFSAPFTYDPLNGNLLLDVNVSGASAPGGDIYFDAGGSNSISRVFNYSGIPGNPGLSEDYGLVTGFETGSAVPEPSFLPVLGGALGLVAFAGLARRRRVAEPAQF